MSATARLSGPADMLAVLPYLLGYHPTGSLVVVAIGDGGRMGVVQRIDLPQAGESAHAAASALVPALLRDGARSVTIIGYEMITGSSVAPAEVLSGLAAAEGIEVVDTLVVRGDRWWSTACEDPTCCPAEGKPLSGTSAAAAELIGVGCAPLPNRTAVAARLAPTARAASLVAECERQSGTPGEITAARGLAAWARVLGTTDDVPVTDLPDSALCLAALVLQDIEARDGLIAWLTPGTLPLDLVRPDLIGLLDKAIQVPWRKTGETAPIAGAESSHRAQDRLMTLCANLPDSHACPALTMLANLAWWRGDGAIARLALDRALAADPGYRLAILLSRMVELGIRQTDR